MTAANRLPISALGRGVCVAPRVVPFVCPYRNRADVGTWFNDPEIFALIESELRRDAGYRGIGEFHVSGSDAGTERVKRIVAPAWERDLRRHAHRDDAALEILFGHDPRVKIVRAHTGFSTPPARIARYREHQPNLVGELSSRYDVTERGKLAPARRALFLAHPGRFVVGSDGWVNGRREHYAEIMAYCGASLAQLPQDVAVKIASGSGERPFSAHAQR